MIAFLAALLLFTVSAEAWELGGTKSFEVRGFYQKGAFTGQDRFSLSPSLEPEISHNWNGGNETFTFKAFFRYDSQDSDRTHWDIRQLDWTKTFGDWELRIGARKVFWGVTESVHLVDFINQIDFVENLDGEDRLGQPMVNLSRITDNGTFDVFILPFFRERTHASPEGRFRFALPVSDTNESFESGARHFHPDTALRWFHTLGLVDLGLYHFYGTNREPRYIPDTTTDPANPVLLPRYDLVHQTGLDAQLTWEGWLWKLEVLSRFWEPEHYFAAAGGFEYTFNTVFGTRSDLGFLIEYLWDERRSTATTPFENDIFSGFRLALNDEDDFQLLAGTITDLGSGGLFFNVEASRRIGNNWEWSLETRIFANLDQSDFLQSFARDDYTQLEVTYFF